MSHRTIVRRPTPTVQWLQVSRRRAREAAVARRQRVRITPEGAATLRHFIYGATR